MSSVRLPGEAGIIPQNEITPTVDIVPDQQQALPFVTGEESGPSMLERLRGKWTTFVAVGAAALALGTVQSLEERPAYAVNTETAVIGMPFAGKWSTFVHPSTHGPVYPQASSDWATDIYAVPGTEARLKVGKVSGNATYTTSNVADTSCGAGKRVRVDVKVDNVNVGWVQYEHLDTTLGNNVSLNPGDLLGTTKKWRGPNNEILPCYQVSNDAGVHLHVGMKNVQDKHSCYTSYEAQGVLLGEGTDLGILGSPNDGIQQACDTTTTPSPSPTPTTPTPDIRVPVPANFDGVLGQDLLGSSKRTAPDITPNLNVFPSTGSWLGTNQLWSTPTGINWAEARLTAGDLDGDGKDDLLAIQNRDDGHPNIYWLKSQGSSFAAPQLVGVPGLWFNDVKEWVSGDYNGDGHADLLAVSKRGEPTEDPAPNLVVFPSSGDWLGGSQLWGAPLSLKFADMKVVPADVDNDGKTDLLSVQPASSDTNANPQIWWSRSTGSGFENPQLVGVPNLKANETKWVAGNFDGQGGVDLVTSAKRQDGASNLLVFRATGSWLGGSELWGSPAINWQAAAMVPADLDGDGKTDLISIQKRGDGNPDIIWSRSTGTGFEAPQIVGIPSLVADGVRWQS